MDRREERFPQRLEVELCSGVCDQQPVAFGTAEEPKHKTGVVEHSAVELSARLFRQHPIVAPQAQEIAMERKALSVRLALARIQFAALEGRSRAGSGTISCASGVP